MVGPTGEESVVKGTKLRQTARSPLISGTSRYHRSFFQDWIRAWGLAFLLGYGVMVVAMYLSGTGFETALRVVWMPALPASALGAVPGTWIARRMGWRSPWILGGVLGVVFVGFATVWFATYLVSSVNG
jgi:hypothetical protein